MTECKQPIGVGHCPCSIVVVWVLVLIRAAQVWKRKGEVNVRSNCFVSPGPHKQIAGS